MRRSNKTAAFRGAKTGKVQIIRSFDTIRHNGTTGIGGTTHSNRVVFVFGGWYARNAGWWYPAWGYAPNAYYAYDGPIYAYNNMPPDQAIANAQAALQALGYYHGPINGILGALTRVAIADYQRDHGLYITSAIDEQTLASLGMA